MRYIVLSLLLLSALAFTNAQETDHQCVACQQQCSDFEAEWLSFSESAAYRNWTLYNNFACNWKRIVAFEIPILQQADQMTKDIYKFVQSAVNYQVLSKLSSQLWGPINQLYPRYQDVLNQWNQFNLNYQLAPICDLSQPLIDGISAADKFYSDILSNAVLASKVQNTCGFDACAALSRTTEQLAALQPPTFDFPGYPENYYSFVKGTNTEIYNFLSYVNYTIFGYIVPALAQTYTVVENGQTYTATGYEVVNSYDPAVLARFKTVLDTLQGLSDTYLDRLVDFLQSTVGYTVTPLTGSFILPNVNWPKLDFGDKFTSCINALEGGN